MSDLPAEAVQAAAEALRNHQWGRNALSAHSKHNKHRHHGDCKVCQGDVVAITAVVAPFIAEHIAREIESHCGAYSHDPEEILRCGVHNGARLVREVFAGECSVPVPVQVAPNATESAPHPLPGVPGSLNAPERISAPRNVPVSDMTEAQRMTLAYNAANAMRGVHKRRADNLRTELDHAQAALAGDNEAVQAFMADHEAKAARLREGSAMWQREAEKAEAAIDRVHAEHAAIHAEMDDYAKRHNRACECEVIPTTRETADRMLAALSVPAPPKETPNG